MDLEQAFAKFETRHKADSVPAAQNPHLNDWTEANYKSRAKPAEYDGSLLFLGWLFFWAGVLALAIGAGFALLRALS
jgi:hypothetical protein